MPSDWALLAKAWWFDPHPRKEVKGKVKLSDIKEKIEDKMLDADFMSKFSLWVSIASLISAALTLYVTLKH